MGRLVPLRHGTDIMVVRELIGGIYFGKPKGFGVNEEGHRTGFNTMVGEWGREGPLFDAHGRECNDTQNNQSPQALLLKRKFGRRKRHRRVGV
jgi:hypothetical protein